MKGVEGVEELLLGAVLPGQELDVVDEQDVDGAVARPEVRGAVLLDGGDHLVHELLGGDIGHLGRSAVALADGVSDGLHEVRLAQPHASVQEERVVGLAGSVGDGAAGGVGEPTAVAHHERREHEVGVEPGGVAAVYGRFSDDPVSGLRSISDGGGLVRWWPRCRIDGDHHLAVVREQAADGFADHRCVAFDQPVTRQPRGHADGEGVPVAVDENRVGEPGFVAGTGQLKAQFLLRSLPNLLGFRKDGDVCSRIHIHVVGNARSRQFVSPSGGSPT